MRERASPARGERCSGLCYGENACVWYTGTAEPFAPLDLGWNDRMAVIG
jgi:hypothetical protein